ncbi:nickel insertion protein [Nitriliruptor alkaliphilus]|uniref:nickel insertion protein n=1 Tax=Nitriliruptor alkaliphilus TaxID=427918 RepID=UPI000698C441|nr:nickel insertion protein [Nitriliruptor alkaliphilus]
MAVLHLLCDDGITGELWLSALVAVGADAGELQGVVERAGLSARLLVERVEAREVGATRVRVEVDPSAPRAETPTALAGAVDAAAAAAELSDRAHHRMHRIVGALADAEAAVHGRPRDHVRFHELGRPRTLVLLVAAAAALELLDVDTITTSPIAVGSGTIDIAHGRFPVPPPAVLELLRGFVIEGGPRPGELTTPSGAAVLAALAEPVAGIPRLRLERAGRGAAGDGRDVRLLTVLLGSAVIEPSGPDALVGAGHHGHG